MSQSSERQYEFAAFRLDVANKRLMRGGEVVPLTPKLFDTLLLLVERAPRLVEKDDFVRRLWPRAVVEESALAENISRLRRALGESEAQRFIETQPKRGYRFVAVVRASGAVSVNEPPPSAALSPPAHRVWKVAFAATLLVALAVSLALYFKTRDTAPIRSLAVLPFVNLSADPEQDYFTDGMTDELITELAQIRALRVISRSSVMRYKSTTKPLVQIASELGVDAVVEGTVSRSADRIRLTAQVVRVSPEEHLWAQRYERATQDVVILEGQLAREIADGIRLELTPDERRGLESQRSVSPVAHEAYLKGRFFWAQRAEAGTLRAREYFQQAIDAEPEYALAYAGVADSFITLALPDALQEVLAPNVAYPQALDAIQRALQIDDTLAEAHASLAHIKFQYERDWPGAEREFQRALALNPSYANAHQWFALEQFWSGHGEESLRQIRAAHELDPLSLAVNANECFLLAGVGLFDEALAQCRRALELDADFALAHYRFGQVYIARHEYPQAIAELQRAVQLSGECPRALAELGLAFALSGDKHAASAVLEQLNDASPHRYVSPFDLAVLHAALGDNDAALAALQRADLDHAPSLSQLQWSPAFTALRENSRFVELVRQVGLPH
jgi:TolB-like protein/DNA-binding winged helix-turn-helix (wHTH) protein/Tfp pilus assembly protein PilF